MGKLRVGLIFGGRSVEHDVSLVSARAVYDHLDRARFDVIPIGVTRAGRWLTSQDSLALFEKGPAGMVGDHVSLPAEPGVRGLIAMENGRTRAELDIVFPLIHGAGGEDGTLQGLLELADVPYVGSGVLGSSLGMDKIAMKAAFAAAGLASTPFLPATRRRIRQDNAALRQEIADRLGFPCFTKPANGGSSVGITRVSGPDELQAGLEEASQYDRRVLIETAVDAREVECAVLGNDIPEASVVGEIVPCNDFYDYSAKYIEEGSELVVPARIGEEVSGRVRELAVRAFTAIDAAGMGRVDFFIDRNSDDILINEINTIPGFTPISMYPRLWEASGLEFTALVERLIELGLERHKESEATRRDWTPEVPAKGNLKGEQKR